MARQLQPVSLVVPGSKGLNTQARGDLLGPEWATKLENTGIDANGRVSGRKGWDGVTSTPHPNPFVAGIEYFKSDGTTQIVCTTDTEVVTSVDGGQTWSTATGTASFTSGQWYLVNFNDLVIGFQEDEKPLVYDGASASQVADANAPIGGVGTAAFGRLWAVDADGVTLRYSALLNHADWSGAGAGLFDLSSVWPDNDVITAIAAYNNVLVVFGSRNTIVLGDGTGSEIGLDPANAMVVDTIPGVGCLSQHSVQLVNGDIWFISNSRELVSLQRVLLEQKSGQITTLSRHVSDLLRDSIDNGSLDHGRIRSVFSFPNRFYLLSLPVESTAGSGDEIGKVFAFDTRSLLEDGSARCIGVWNQLVPTVFVQRRNGTLLMALHTAPGELGQYSQYQDNGAGYRVVFETGWLDILQQAPHLAGRILILKRLAGRFLFDVQTNVVLKWAFDFDTRFTSRQLVFESAGGLAEWGRSEWGVAEWGGGVNLEGQNVSGSGAGQYIKVGVEAAVNGGEFSIQQIDLLAKVGRIKG